ncbi:MAG: hypothetical protein ILO68_06760 [Clostridia bacterium]|nr:hypothetical protein [Clostridia bacterium]
MKKHMLALFILPLTLFVSCTAFAMGDEGNPKDQPDEILSASAEPAPQTGLPDDNEPEAAADSLAEPDTNNQDSGAEQLAYPHGWSREYQKRAEGGWLCEGMQYPYKLHYAINEGFGDNARLLEIEVLSQTTEVDWGEAFVLSRGLESSGKRAKEFNENAVIVDVKMWDSPDPSLPVANDTDDPQNKKGEMARITVEE